MNKQFFEQIFEENKERYISEWKEFLRFKSISADPAYNEDCLACANWTARHLRSIGLESELLETGSKPTVFAKTAGATAKGVLFYGHYDVQPVDPIELWTSDPFEPEIRGGRLYARGAEDNKGQVFYFLKALEVLQQKKLLKVPVKLLIEGEEESGGEGIDRTVNSWADKIKSEILMVCDTGSLVAGYPAITMGLRGIIFVEVKLGGISHDLHSGAHGGMLKNPAVELARIVASLHNPDGSIAVKGYYDQVAEIDPEDRRLANDLPYSDEWYTGLVGVPPLGGEQKFTPIERRGFRPTVEVNGFHSGYGGQGSKTIIPAQATVKITSRLCGGQDPKRCLDLLVEHIQAHAPKGLTLEFVEKGIGGAALLLSSKDPVVKKARDILDQIGPHRTIFMWEGGSIPIVPKLAAVAQATPLLVGFGLDEDRIHAPDESFSIEQLKQGYLYASMFLSSL